MAVRLDRNWKTFRLKDFSGGWASNPQKEQEAASFVNLEVTREGYARTCFGSRRFNTTDISDSNTYIVHSLGSGSTASGDDSTFIAGTTENKLWAGYGREYPIGMLDITGAASLTGNYWVFQQFNDTTGNRLIAMGNYLDGLWYFDGAADIVQAASAPVPIILITAYQGHLFIVKQPNQLYFSDHLDATSWPGANLLEFSMERGAITGVASIPGKLLVFFQKGMGEITGATFDKFADSFRMIGSTGTFYPLTISAYGSEIAMLTPTGPVIIDPTGTTTEFIGEQVKEFFAQEDDENLDQFTWRGVLTPFYYALIRFPDPSIYLYDRRTKTWSKKTVPNGMNPLCIADLEYAYTPQGSGYTMPTSGILFGAQDGYINILHLAGLAGTDLEGDNAQWDSSPTTPVTANWKSKEFDFGSHNVLKTIRRVLLNIKGTNIIIRCHYRLKDGTIDTEEFTGYTGPVDTCKPFIIDSAPRLCRAFSLEVEGEDLELRQVTIVYKDKRLIA